MKKKMFCFIGVLVVIFSFCSYAIGQNSEKKSLVEIDVSIYWDSFQTQSNKYIDDSSGDVYFNSFITELQKSLSGYNIETVINRQKDYSTGATYVLTLVSLTFREGYKVENVLIDAEATVPQQFIVTNCSFTADLKLVKIDQTGRKKLLKFFNSVSYKYEKLSNNRTLTQITFGENKDNSIYTYTELDDDIIFQLIRKTAGNVASKSSKIISKNSKK